MRNPFALNLTLPDTILKPLRTNAQYLEFISAVTLLHQFSREAKKDAKTKEEYIETTIEDVQLANDLLKHVLLTKADDLKPELRQFFQKLKAYLRESKKEQFKQKELARHFRYYPMKVCRYVQELEARGLISQAGGNKKEGYDYKVDEWNDYEELHKAMDSMNSSLGDLKEKPSITENNIRITKPTVILNPLNDNKSKGNKTKYNSVTPKTRQE